MKKFSLFLLTVVCVVGQNFPAYTKGLSGESDIYVIDEKEENENFQNKIMWTNAVDDPLPQGSTETAMSEIVDDTLAGKKEESTSVPSGEEKSKSTLTGTPNMNFGSTFSYLTGTPNTNSGNSGSSNEEYDKNKWGDYGNGDVAIPETVEV